MNKYLRKNGKKIMAVLGVLLMIAFALPTATNFSRVDATLGTINDGKTTLTGREFNRYMQQWQRLKQELGPIGISAVLGGASQLGEDGVIRALADPQSSMQLQQLASFRQRNPSTYFQLLQMMPDVADLSMLEGRGEAAYVQIEESPELFMLLAREAEAMGVGANDDLIQTILQRRGVTSEEDPDRYAALHDGLRTLLSINNTAALASSVVKASQPQRTHLLATQRQQLSVGLVEFDAKDFLDKVPAPTPEQVKAQFEKYKDVEPEAGSDPSNPLGFGYKYPDRVKYDAILIKKDDVRKGVPPVEPEDAAEYYLRNKGDFTATSMPTTQGSSALSLAPTTRQKTLTESREQIAKTLTDRRTNELMTKVREAVRSTMKADYDAYRAATRGATTTRPTTGATAAAAPASSLGVPYNSYDYLKKLRDKVQAEHKVTLTIEQQDAWQTPKELDESKLGKNGFAIQDLGLTFPRFMTSRVAPFLSEDQRKELSSRSGENKPVEVWEATPAFTDVTEDLLIARATAADPTHAPATLDEVKDRVATDVKLAAAYEQAKKAAQALVDAAKAGKWLSAVAAGQGKKVVTTGLFGAQESGLGGPMPVSGYDLKGRALSDFVQGAYKLLTLAPRPGGSAPRAAATQASATTNPATTQAKSPTTAPAVATATFKDHPVGLIEVPADAKVLAAEVDQLKPTWTKDREGFFNTQASIQSRFETEQRLRQAWYQFDNVAARLGYHPTEKRERKTPRQTVPINPFTGTMTP